MKEGRDGSNSNSSTPVIQAKNINKSLSALGNVIKALADKAVSAGLRKG